MGMFQLKRNDEHAPKTGELKSRGKEVHGSPKGKERHGKKKYKKGMTDGKRGVNSSPPEETGEKKRTRLKKARGTRMPEATTRNKITGVEGYVSEMPWSTGRE